MQVGLDPPLSPSIVPVACFHSRLARSWVHLKPRVGFQGCPTGGVLSSQPTAQPSLRLVLLATLASLALLECAAKSRTKLHLLKNICHFPLFVSIGFHHYCFFAFSWELEHMENQMHLVTNLVSTKPTTKAEFGTSRRSELYHFWGNKHIVFLFRGIPNGGFPSVSKPAKPGSRASKLKAQVISPACSDPCGTLGNLISEPRTTPEPIWAEKLVLKTRGPRSQALLVLYLGIAIERKARLVLSGTLLRPTGPGPGVPPTSLGAILFFLSQKSCETPIDEGSGQSRPEMAAAAFEVTYMDLLL